jgi:hypothetical protein
MKFEGKRGLICIQEKAGSSPLKQFGMTGFELKAKS